MVFNDQDKKKQKLFDEVDRVVVSIMYYILSLLLLLLLLLLLNIRLV